jgi:hypothetical protein
MIGETWTPVCEVCRWRPKMDRCSCCEDCWYSGRYARAMEEEHLRRTRPEEWMWECQRMAGLDA